MFLLFLALAALFAGLGFLAVLRDVLAEETVRLADQAVYNFFQSLRTPWTDVLFTTITELGDSFVNVCVAGAVLFVLFFRGRRRSAAYWSLAVGGGLLGVHLLKWALRLPRPVDLYQGSSAFGFPSGHAAMSVVIYGFLALLVARGLSAALRWGLLAAVFLISFVIAMSRLYLGAHWFSDVIGGFLIGAGWTALLGIAYLKGPVERIPRKLLCLVAILTIATAGGWHAAQRHEKDLVLYAPRHAVKNMEMQTWLSGGWRELPPWRIDLAGEREQPLTFQWAGSCEELARFLLANDWRSPPSLNLNDLLRMLSSDPSIERLPLLPRLHNGRFESLRLMRMQNGRRWVLRLWPTDVRITGMGLPLFVGNVEVQKRRRLAGLIVLARGTGDYERPLEALELMLGGRFLLKTVDRTGKEIRDGGRRSRPHWTGEVLLARPKTDQ